MEIIGCGRGHYYNPEQYSSCPECAKEQNPDILSATEPVDFNKYANSFSGVGVTEPVNYDAFAGDNDIGHTEPVGTGNSWNMMNTTDFKNGSTGSKVQEYAPTMPVTPANVTGVASGTPFVPVVGWLVCVSGPAKGRDYRIHSQYNYIGRGQHMDICISGDNHISTDRAAILAYDPQEKFFSFGPGMGHNVVRVNGKMLMNAVQLNAYDELTIGETKLLFVPLCGERFDWE